MNGWPERLRMLLLAVGSIGLLAAMGIDALAVVGRHVGLPLLGSIEIIQAAVLVSGAIALLCATLARGHARVHLLLDRVAPASRVWLHGAAALAGAVLFAAFFVGSAWIALDLWHGQEESELLHVPYSPLRVLATAVCAAVAVTFFAQIYRKRP